MRSCVLRPASCVLLLIALSARADSTAEIRALLDAQVAAWNRGDLEGYMAGYWKSPELTFYSGSTITQGWQPTLDRYRKRYQSEGHEMGKLTFSELHVEAFDATHAIAWGRWKLDMKDGKSPNGLFTVVLKKFDEGWRIVHDHSS